MVNTRRTGFGLEVIVNNARLNKMKFINKGKNMISYAFFVWLCEIFTLIIVDNNKIISNNIAIDNDGGFPEEQKKLLTQAIVAATAKRKEHSRLFFIFLTYSFIFNASQF